MRRKRKATVLTLVALCTVGCAHSDSRFSDRGQPRWRAPDNVQWQIPSTSNIPEEFEDDPPQILPETYFAAARLFESQGLLNRAIAQYRRAIAVNHNYAEAYHRLGVLLSMAGHRSEALKNLQRAVQLKPDQPIFRNDLGFEFVLNRRWNEAEPQFVRAIELKPDFARAYVNLGIAQSKLGRFEDALVSFQSVLPDPDAYYNLGLMYRGQRRYEEANEAFRCALSTDPNFNAAETQLAQIRERRHPGTSFELAEGTFSTETAHEPQGFEQVDKGTSWKAKSIQARTAASQARHRKVDVQKPSAPKRDQKTRTMAATVVTSIGEYLRRDESSDDAFDTEGPVQPEDRPAVESDNEYPDAKVKTQDIAVHSKAHRGDDKPAKAKRNRHHKSSTGYTPPAERAMQKPKRQKRTDPKSDRSVTDPVPHKPAKTKDAVKPLVRLHTDENTTDTSAIPDSGPHLHVGGDSLIDETTSTIHALRNVDPRTDLDTMVSILDNEIDCLEEKGTLAFGTSETTLFDPASEKPSSTPQSIATNEVTETEDEEPCVEVLIVYEHVPTEPAPETVAKASPAKRDKTRTTPETANKRQARSRNPVKTMASTTIESFDTDGPVSFAPAIIATPFVPTETIELLTDGMAEKTFSPWQPPVTTTPETIASVDPKATLRELEERLLLVREEITCLDELGEPEIVMIAENEPADDRPKARVKLVSEVVKEQATKKNVSKPSAKSKAKQRDEARKQRKRQKQSQEKAKKSSARKKKVKKPAGLPLSWRRTFQKLDDLRSIMLNEINCMNDTASSTVDLQTPTGWPGAFEYSYTTQATPIMGFSTEAATGATNRPMSSTEKKPVLDTSVRP